MQSVADEQYIFNCKFFQLNKSIERVKIKMKYYLFLNLIFIYKYFLFKRMEPILYYSQNKI